MKKRVLYMVLLAGVLVSAYSCKKDEPYIDDTPAPVNQGNLKLRFHAHYNGTPFVLFNDYYTLENYRIRPELLRFLATEFWTKNEAGDSLYLYEAFKYNLETGQTSFTIPMAPGNYDGIGLSIGVNEQKNHDDPSQYPADHALSYATASDMFWTWSTGYIFSKYEGKADTSGNGTGPLDLFYIFHSGHDTLYRVLPHMDKPYTITSGQTTELVVHINAAAFFASIVDTIDLKQENETHTANNLPLAIKFSDMFKRSFSLP
jgi:hypothetical protein